MNQPIQHHQQQIEQRDTRSLRVHKLRKHFPAIDREAADWIALTDSVCASGIQQPIVITPEGFIVDGVWRWESAKDWQFATVPCVTVPDHLAGVIIAESLIARKQMTRGAAVYLLIPIRREIVSSAEDRRLDNLKRNRQTNEIELNPQYFSMSSNSTSEAAKESIRALCFRWGISKDTFYKANSVWLWLNEPDCAALKKLHIEMNLGAPEPAALRILQEELKSDFEPALLIGEKNLWNVESGIKGRLTGGAHEPPVRQLELFGSALDSLATRAERFESPEKAAPEIRKWIKALEAGAPVEEVVAKLQVVAETCEITRVTIKEHLKKLAMEKV